MSKATELVLYNTCLRMITRGSTEDLAGKIDVFYAAGKLTEKHYTELTELLAREEEKEATDNGN